MHKKQEVLTKTEALNYLGTMLPSLADKSKPVFIREMELNEFQACWVELKGFKHGLGAGQTEHQLREWANFQVHLLLENLVRFDLRAERAGLTTFGGDAVGVENNIENLLEKVTAIFDNWEQ